MGVKTSILVHVFLLWVTIPAFSVEKIKVPCEVMEVSEPFTSASSRLRAVRYVLLHHAENADRETLSRWLKANSGREVRFIANHKEYRGILCRLAHCFGRGLLIYEDNVRPKKKDVIEVILSTPP